ncbi:DUF2946 family protein [Meiothermus cerbereus]|uniref:DUF2946 family protein n=1 Tax=Meiothermus cerbereus TaxID=65552 RepID=UPI003EEA60CB
MSAAPAQARRALWVLFLAGLVLLVSSQYALRDPQSHALPVHFLPGVDLCTSPAGSSQAPSTPSPTHTHQPHCPLCVMGGFSDGAPPFVALPQPVLQIGERLWPLEAAQPSLESVFPRLNRGPPQLG